MFLTRLGYDSKAVVTGDVTQVDLPGGPHERAGGGAGAALRHRGHRVLPLHRGGRGAPPAGAADHRCAYEARDARRRRPRRAKSGQLERGLRYLSRGTKTADILPAAKAVDQMDRVADAPRPRRPPDGRRGHAPARIRSWSTWSRAQRRRRAERLASCSRPRGRVGPRARAPRTLRAPLRRGDGAPRPRRPPARHRARADAMNRGLASVLDRRPTPEELYLACDARLRAARGQGRAESRGKLAEPLPLRARRAHRHRRAP